MSVELKPIHLTIQTKDGRRNEAGYVSNKKTWGFVKALEFGTSKLS